MSDRIKQMKMRAKEERSRKIMDPVLSSFLRETPASSNKSHRKLNSFNGLQFLNLFGVTLLFSFLFSQTFYAGVLAPTSSKSASNQSPSPVGGVSSTDEGTISARQNPPPPLASNVLENEIVGEPDIECLDQEIRVWVKTRRPFQGRIYAKGKADDPACSKDDFGTRTEKKAQFELGLGMCGMKSLRSYDPRGMYYGITIVISFHPLFITRRDQAFHVKCFFEEANRGLTAELGVSMVPTTELEARHGIPGCVYSIHRSSIEELDAGNPAGIPITFAKVGDKVLHQWHCDDQMFGILINNCYVTDGVNKKADVIDDRGCPVDPILITGIRYSADLQRAYAESQVFKFADRPGVWFFCQIQMCMKKHGMCEQVTPPACEGGMVRGGAGNVSSISLTAAGGKNRATNIGHTAGEKVGGGTQPHQGGTSYRGSSGGIQNRPERQQPPSQQQKGKVPVVRQQNTSVDNNGGGSNKRTPLPSDGGEPQQHQGRSSKAPVVPQLDGDGDNQASEEQLKVTPGGRAHAGQRLQASTDSSSSSDEPTEKAVEEEKVKEEEEDEEKDDDEEVPETYSIVDNNKKTLKTKTRTKNASGDVVGVSPPSATNNNEETNNSGKESHLFWGSGTGGARPPAIANYQPPGQHNRNQPPTTGTADDPSALTADSSSSSAGFSGSYSGAGVGGYSGIAPPKLVSADTHSQHLDEPSGAALARDPDDEQLPKSVALPSPPPPGQRVTIFGPAYSPTDLTHLFGAGGGGNGGAEDLLQGGGLGRNLPLAGGAPTLSPPIENGSGGGRSFPAGYGSGLEPILPLAGAVRRRQELSSEFETRLEEHFERQLSTANNRSNTSAGSHQSSQASAIGLSSSANAKFRAPLGPGNVPNIVFPSPDSGSSGAGSGAKIGSEAGDVKKDSVPVDHHHQQHLQKIQQKSSIGEKRRRSEGPLPPALNSLLSKLQPEEINAGSLQRLFQDSVADRRALLEGMDAIRRTEENGKLKDSNEGEKTDDDKAVLNLHQSEEAAEALAAVGRGVSPKRTKTAAATKGKNNKRPGDVVDTVHVAWPPSEAGTEDDEGRQVELVRIAREVSARNKSATVTGTEMFQQKNLRPLPNSDKNPPLPNPPVIAGQLLIYDLDETPPPGSDPPPTIVSDLPGEGIGIGGSAVIEESEAFFRKHQNNHQQQKQNQPKSAEGNSNQKHTLKDGEEKGQKKKNNWLPPAILSSIGVETSAQEDSESVNSQSSREQCCLLVTAASTAAAIVLLLTTLVLCVMLRRSNRQRAAALLLAQQQHQQEKNGAANLIKKNGNKNDAIGTFFTQQFIRDDEVAIAEQMFPNGSSGGGGGGGLSGYVVRRNGGGGGGGGVPQQLVGTTTTIFH